MNNDPHRQQIANRDSGPMKDANFKLSLDRMAERINKWAHGNGFWDFDHLDDATLMHIYLLARQHHKITKNLERERGNPQPPFEWPKRPHREVLELVAKIVLMHSELSELLEGVVVGGMDDHLPEYRSDEAESADVIIRLLDFAWQTRQRLADAILQKQKYNEQRPFRNGKAF